MKNVQTHRRGQITKVFSVLLVMLMPDVVVQEEATADALVCTDFPLGKSLLD